MVNQAFYMHFLDEALEIIIVFDKHGKVIYMNKQASKFLGYPEKFEISIGDIFPEAFSCADNKVIWADVVGSGTSIQPAYRYNRTCVDTLMRASLVKSEYMTVVLALDISVEKNLERRMSMANSRLLDATGVKDRFIANISHELRTPINGITGNIDVLISDETDSEKLATMRVIKEQCDNMRRTVDNLIDITKITENKDVEFEFSQIVDYVKEEHVGKIVDKGLNFFLDVAHDIPNKLYGDADKLKQILGILLSNALKFTASGQISLEAVKTGLHDDGVELYFIVSDTGIGISEENKAHLFDSFSQVEQDTDRHYGGMGMGLWIGKRLVEQMGGNIRVDSEENKGSVFSFSVCLKEVADEASEDTYTYIPTYTGGVASDMSFGTVKDVEELKKKLSKLILCIELGNWTRAEGFMEEIRGLTITVSSDVKRIALKLKMSVQKADYDGTKEAYEMMQQALEGEQKDN